MDFIAFDLETTGIRPESDAVVEVGAARFAGGEVVDTFGTLIDPQRPIPPDASAVNGITDEMVAGQPDIATVLDQLADFCGELPLVAHNAPFDFKFLLFAVRRHRARAPAGVVLDSCSLSRCVFPGMLNYKLGTLVSHFGFPIGTLHRAVEDSICCGRLFVHILNALRQSDQPVALPDLLALSRQPQMIFPRYEKRPEQLGLF